LADVQPQRLVEEGDSVDQVLAATTTPKFKAAETPFWTHGPEHGTSHHLKFIDGKRVEIRAERQGRVLCSGGAPSRLRRSADAAAVAFTIAAMGRSYGWLQRHGRVP